MDLNFFNQPLAFQVALGGGYLGYLAAYTGIRDRHRQIDIAFLTIAFGIVGAVAFGLMEERGGTIAAASAGAVGPVLVGILWRKAGRGVVRSFYRLCSLSYADDDASAFTKLFADTDHHVSQVMVALTDGSEFLCRSTADFADAPFGPLTIGADGSVALYVTHTYRPDSNGTLVEREQTGTRDKEWGDLLTVIPASAIKQVDIRYLGRKRP